MANPTFLTTSLKTDPEAQVMLFFIQTKVKENVGAVPPYSTVQCSTYNTQLTSALLFWSCWIQKPTQLPLHEKAFPDGLTHRYTIHEKTTMAFSATCPTVSIEQVKAEINALSEDEYTRLQDDLYNRNCHAKPKPPQKALETAVHMLQDAIEDMPLTAKKAYLAAQERDPSLIARESNPYVFLRNAEYDCWKAASCLTAYWKLRLELFGADRAFLPMTQEGAMKEDKEILYAPAVMVAPPLGCDGRFTLLADRARMIRLPGGSRAIFVSTFLCVRINSLCGTSLC